MTFRPRSLTASLEVWLLRTAILAASVFAAASASAAEFRLFPDAPPGSRFAEVRWTEPSTFTPNLELAAALERTAWPLDSSEPPGHAYANAAMLQPLPPPDKLFTTATIVWSIGAVAGGAVEGLGAPLQYGWVKFHTTDEGWFSRNTYAGGADKASHFIISSGVSRTLYEAYTYLGHSPDTSAKLAFATTFMTGTMVELLDGASVYGFSFQDLTVDALGAAAGVLIQRNHLEDMLGLKIGLADTDIPDSAVIPSVPTLGRSYSNELYSADFKFAGLVRRLHRKPGFERFFLTTFVYYTKGFGYDPPLPTRYQAIGFEVGLNFREILLAVGVTKDTWWGQGLFAIFDFFRIPFSQIGVYYNMFNNKWYGPGAPYHYY